MKHGAKNILISGFDWTTFLVQIARDLRGTILARSTKLTTVKDREVELNPELHYK